jgi:hypothetical protein
MNALKKTFIGASIIALPLVSGSAFAQNNNSKGKESLAFNTSSKAKTELVSEKKEMDSPIVMEAENSFQAELHSHNERIAIHVHQDPSDPISGYRYARGLANAATDSSKTGNRPMYIFASYKEGTSSVGSFTSIYIDGIPWSYKGEETFSPHVVGQLLPVLMYEYEQEFGTDRFIPENVTPQIVASLD